MDVSYARTLAAGLTLVVLAGGAVGLSAGARAEQAGRPEQPSRGAPAAAPGRFSADLIVRHRRLTPSGVPMGVIRPDVVMRVVREARGGRWMTSLSAGRIPDALVQGPRGSTLTLDNPFLVTRVEMADDEEQPRLFDSRGRAVRPLSEADLQLVGAARSVQRGIAGRPEKAAVAGVLVAEAGGEQTRRHELERRFGPAAGRVRGLDRYVASSAEGRHEVLVRPDVVLPVEMLTTAAGHGEMRTGVTYETHGRHGYVRRLLRTEHHLPEAGAGRAVTEVELANIAIDDEVLR